MLHVPLLLPALALCLPSQAENTAAFRECVIIRHPRRGEYAFAFITGQCTLQGDDGASQHIFPVAVWSALVITSPPRDTASTTTQPATCSAGDQELFSVFIPTNHIYVGDIVMLGPSEILRPNLTVREGLEIVVSCGCALPPLITSLPAPLAGRIGSFANGGAAGIAAGLAGGSHGTHHPTPGVYGISSAPLDGRGGMFGGAVGGAGAQGKTTGSG